MRARGFFRKVWVERDAHVILREILLSDCPSGCKEYSCTFGDTHLIHNSIYGCKELNCV